MTDTRQTLRLCELNRRRFVCPEVFCDSPDKEETNLSVLLHSSRLDVTQEKEISENNKDYIKTLRKDKKNRQEVQLITPVQ